MSAFYDPEESEFYGLCVEDLFRRHPKLHKVYEFGVGSGEAVCGALRRGGFLGQVHGFEIDARSADIARDVVRGSGLAHRYHVTHADFFTVSLPDSERTCVIANPPYLPLLDGQPRYPHLSGGVRGTTVSERILSAGFDTVMMMISSYADPRSLLHHAMRCGYTLTSWMVRPIRMGRFSRRPAVHRRIRGMSRAGAAFVAGDTYLLAGGIWRRSADYSYDETGHLDLVMTRFGASGPDEFAPGPPLTDRMDA
ncbi:methyltransferase [Nonomuraea cavernae]|uniref:Methyltransferase n=1 Tax=Nonomuraea cavernae TaxID=2045107 RepID=A0A917YRC1_9ACTN|nr:methyltransferase [Nonomuraea cavernae]MCA2183667.1 hypothetical protein [Nonomuraea cavernae]GGO60997.1 hypothetical protein GCM10012289_02180 [Nonomuraea cavernae]